MTCNIYFVSFCVRILLLYVVWFLVSCVIRHDLVYVWFAGLLADLWWAC